MSVQRRVNWISQQRVDVPDVRAIESAASADFDGLIESVLTGTSQGYVLRGFEILMGGAIGGAASGLQVLVDPGAVLHVTSSQSGTFYLVPSGTPTQQLNSATNTIVDGAFAPSAVNYVGIEYERFIDDGTAAQVYIWDPSSNNETTKIAPRAQILRYRFKITTTVWAANVLPIAIVITDAGNNVADISDARYNFFRLGTGGASPNPFFKYPWNAQTEGRTENPSTSNSNGVNPFHGGDKMLGTQKDWMNAVMSMFLEVVGGTYWYSKSNAGSLQSIRADLGNTAVTGNSTISHSKTTAGQINWGSTPSGTGQIYLQLIGSRLAYKIAENASGPSVTLADNQVAYISLTRGATIIPNLVFTTNSGPNTTTVVSVGAVSWTAQLQAGDFIRAAGDSDANYYIIRTVDSASQVTLTGQYTIAGMTAAGVQAVYAFGNYTLPGSTGTSRDIVIANREAVPTGADIVWLLFRSDNAGTIPRVYVKFLGAELQQGDSEDISGPQLHEVLQYIGSPIESSTSPAYVSALNAGSVPQITDITCGAASTVTSGQYFFLFSAGSFRKYYVWFNKDSAGGDPHPVGTNDSVEVDITTGQTNIQVATALANALNTITPLDFTAAPKANPNQFVVRITNNSAGVTAATSNFNVSSPFAVATVQSGTGVGNAVVNDGDNLTLAIKKLDEAIGSILLADPAYDEAVDIVVSGATPPTSLNAPVTSGTTITMPPNSRFGNIVQKYTVGYGTLLVFLNGQFLDAGDDWTEVGAYGTQSNQIVINKNLIARDALNFRISTGGGGAGGGAPGPQGPVGPTGPAGAPGSDAAGGPISISTKSSNYTVMLSDCFLRADCSSGNVTFTLPTAASASGRIFYFKKIDATANSMTIKGNGSELLDGINTQMSSTQFESFAVISNGTSWDIF